MDIREHVHVHVHVLVNFLHVYMNVHMQYTVYVSISPPCRLLHAFVPRAQLGAPQVLHYTRPVHVYPSTHNTHVHVHCTHVSRYTAVTLWDSVQQNHPSG